MKILRLFIHEISSSSSNERIVVNDGCFCRNEFLNFFFGHSTIGYTYFRLFGRTSLEQSCNETIYRIYLQTEDTWTNILLYTFFCRKARKVSNWMLQSRLSIVNAFDLQFFFAFISPCSFVWYNQLLPAFFLLQFLSPSISLSLVLHLALSTLCIFFMSLFLYLHAYRNKSLSPPPVPASLSLCSSRSFSLHLSPTQVLFARDSHH